MEMLNNRKFDDSAERMPGEVDLISAKMKTE